MRARFFSLVRQLWAGMSVTLRDGMFVTLRDGVFVSLRDKVFVTLRDNTILRKVFRHLNKLWVRITLIGVLSLVAIAVARLIEPLMPPGIKEAMGAGSVGSLLRIIANSMLAVTTFSLTVMVSVHRAASQQWTPRVQRLMMEDQTTNNTLSTLVGAFIYALASIVLLETQLFADDQVVVLFCFTILILVLIIIAIVRWIVHLQTLGSLIEVTRRIEARAIDALKQRMHKPCLGGHRMDADVTLPAHYEAFTAGRTGYVQYIYEEQLSDLADKLDMDIYVTTTVGAFVYDGTPIAYLGDVDAETRKILIDSIAIGDLRTFEQDARFGLIVMAEIASKALSPGINDAGTAIDVLGRMGRIFENYITEDPTPEEGPVHPRLYMPALDAADLVQDAFDPIARDGAHLVEVQLALHSALAHLAQHQDEALAKAAIRAARRAYERAEKQMTNPHDLDRLRDRCGREITQGA